MGLRWINRGGRTNGLVALLAAIVYTANRRMYDSEGCKVQLGAPGDRVKDHVQTTMAQIAAEKVDREVCRARIEKRDAEEDLEANCDEPHRVLSTEVAVALDQRTSQQPNTHHQRPVHRISTISTRTMSPLIETPGGHEEEEAAGRW